MTLCCTIAEYSESRIECREEYRFRVQSGAQGVLQSAQSRAQSAERRAQSAQSAERTEHRAQSAERTGRGM